MATRTWQDVDGNWTNTANWSGGSAPATSDTIRILDGNKDIITNISQGSLTGTLVIGKDFRGTIGTSTSPLTLGGTFTKVVMSAAHAGTVNLSFGTACTDMIITDTGIGAYAFHVAGGTVTNLYMARGRLRVNASATVTNLHVLWTNARPTDCYVHSEATATLGTVYQQGGVVDCYSSVDTKLIIQSGEFNLIGDSDNTVASLEQWGGTMKIDADGATLTTIVIRGGVTTAKDSRKPVTYAGTSGIVYKGGALLINTDVSTVSNNITIVGGVFNGDDRSTTYSDAGGPSLP